MLKKKQEQGETSHNVMEATIPLTKFQRRYIFPFLGALAIIASIVVWLILRQQAQLLDTELKKKGQAIVQDFANTSMVSILLNDDETIVNNTKMFIASDDDISNAAIFRKDGDLFHSNDSLFALPASLATETEPEAVNLGKEWVFITPIYNANDEFEGRAAISLSRERVLGMMKEAATKLILMTVIISLIIAAIVFWLLNKIRSLADKEFIRAREIESAYKRLQELQGVLKRANETLEERVKERTIELEKTNIELQHVNTELKDFAYIVSHDLKAPLRAIAYLTDWIVEDYSESLDEDGQEQLSLLKNRVNHMYKLLEGILRYSRIGRGEEQKEVINLNESVADVIDSLLPSENFEISIENELPEIYADKTKINQVFQNIISNAIKYNDKPVGQVKIFSDTKDDGYHYFSIADNGKGIPEKDFSRVFKIFQTLEKDKNSTESTGVGLTLVQKIIRKYGGEISLASEVKKGTTFTFSLPVIEEVEEVRGERAVAV